MTVIQAMRIEKLEKQDKEAQFIAAMEPSLDKFGKLMVMYWADRHPDTWPNEIKVALSYAMPSAMMYTAYLDYLRSIHTK